jgi:hypothetical protein
MNTIQSFLFFCVFPDLKGEGCAHRARDPVRLAPVHDVVLHKAQGPVASALKQPGFGRIQKNLRYLISFVINKISSLLISMGSSPQLILYSINFNCY